MKEIPKKKIKFKKFLISNKKSSKEQYSKNSIIYAVTPFSFQKFRTNKLRNVLTI